MNDERVVEGLGNEFLGLPDEPGTDDIDGDGEENLQAELGGRLRRGFHQFVGRRSLDGFDQLDAFRDQRIGRQFLRNGGRGLKRMYQHISDNSIVKENASENLTIKPLVSEDRADGEAVATVNVIIRHSRHRTVTVHYPVIGRHFRIKGRRLIIASGSKT